MIRIVKLKILDVRKTKDTDDFSRNVQKAGRILLLFLYTDMMHTNGGYGKLLA